MKVKVDYSLSIIILLFGIVYLVLTTIWHVIPGRLNLGHMYIPAIALMYIFAGLFNILRLKINQKIVVIMCTVVNGLLLIYATYMTYLMKVSIPLYIATSILALVFLFSLISQPLKKLESDILQ